MMSDECQSLSPPESCGARWCYVASWNCMKPNEPSAFFEGVFSVNTTLLTAAGLHDGAAELLERLANGSRSSFSQTAPECFQDETRAAALTYSYETCGNIDSFTFAFNVENQLANIASRGPLRLSIPGEYICAGQFHSLSLSLSLSLMVSYRVASRPSELPFIATVGENESNFIPGTSRRDGSVPRFFTRILEHHRIDFAETAISEESHACMQLRRPSHRARLLTVTLLFRSRPQHLAPRHSTRALRHAARAPRHAARSAHPPFGSALPSEYCTLVHFVASRFSRLVVYCVLS